MQLSAVVGSEIFSIERDRKDHSRTQIRIKLLKNATVAWAIQ